jgi:putative thioredoxin
MTRVQALKNAGDYAQARTALEQLLASDPDNTSLQTESAELHALEGDLDTARQELQALQGKEPTHPAVKRLAALIAFSDVIAQYPNVRGLREQLASLTPDAAQDATQSLELRHALAVHQLLGGDVEPALQTWLGIMRDHRTWRDDLARRSLVLAFELIGDADPIVARTRRAMTRLLF